MEIVELGGLEVDVAALAKRLHVPDMSVLERLSNAAAKAVDCRAAYRSAYVEEAHADGVVIEGVRFASRVLRINLDRIGRVFPFVLTAGKALDALIDAHPDMLDKYLLNEIGNLALRNARERLERHLRSAFGLEKISFMAPGSLEDWPLEEQGPLFSLLSGVESAIEVRLTESFLMLPRKSISGIYFPSEVTFLSCQLCPREHCDSRKARYDATKAKAYGVFK